MRKYSNIILSTILFFIISLSIIAVLDRNNSSINNIDSKAVNATPVASKVVVIDAGHGKPDEGAVGIYGTTEEAINLKIALKLQRLIEQSGGIVYLTRSDENGIYSDNANTIREKKKSDVRNRVIIGNGEDVDILVSIHLNKYPESKYSGWQTFYQKENEYSKRLAENIQNSLNDAIDKENDRLPRPIDNVYIMKNVENPSVIVECGFLSNPEEAKLLEEEDYQNKLVWGIYIGIQNYFK